MSLKGNEKPPTPARVIGRPAAKLNPTRETAFRKAVRDVLAGLGGNGNGIPRPASARPNPASHRAWPNI